MALPGSPFGQYVLHLILLFPIDQIRGRVQVVCAMYGRLTVGCEKIDVKHWMDAPLRGKFEAIIDRGHHLYEDRKSVV